MLTWLRRQNISYFFRKLWNFVEQHVNHDILQWATDMRKIMDSGILSMVNYPALNAEQTNLIFGANRIVHQINTVTLVYIWDVKLKRGQVQLCLLFHGIISQPDGCINASAITALLKYLWWTCHNFVFQYFFSAYLGEVNLLIAECENTVCSVGHVLQLLPGECCPSCVSGPCVHRVIALNSVVLDRISFNM